MARSLLKQIVEAVSPAKKHLIKKQMEIAAELFAILKEKGLTQRELARMVSKEESYISKILNGESNLTLKTISEIEVVLKMDILVTPKLHAKRTFEYGNKIIFTQKSFCRPNELARLSVGEDSAHAQSDSFNYGMVA
jgi:transcriptional regulator with XRE-family HTH domain